MVQKEIELCKLQISLRNETAVNMQKENNKYMLKELYKKLQSDLGLNNDSVSVLLKKYLDRVQV